MPFVTRLLPDRIVIAPPWRTFAATIEGLVDRLIEVAALPATGRDDAIGAIRAREAEGSTAVLDIGVGVPHARLAALRAPVVALAVSPAGLYEAAPTVAIRIVALVLSPPAALEEHLRILADIATLLRSASLRAALVAARDGAAALDVLVRHARTLP
jgi:mannitol/fructose-specific phosphotransferase system IIA component (Ntr-type)